MSERGQEVLREASRLKAEREPLATTYRDCYDYVEPDLGVGWYEGGTDPIGQARSAENRRKDLLDSTGAVGTRLLASAVLSSLTPSTSRWMGFGARGIELKQDARKWMDDVADIIHQDITDSNYMSEAYEFMTHVMISGMAGLFMTRKVVYGVKKLYFETWPLSSMYVADSMNMGRIDTVYRCEMRTLREVAIEFGEDAIPELLRWEYNHNKWDDKKYEITRCIRPRIKNGKQSQGRQAKFMPWESLVIMGSGDIIHEGGFRQFPVMIPRWKKLPGTDYAHGPVFTALSDLKTLNKLVEIMLQNAAMNTAGMYKVMDDGVINIDNIKVGPGRTIAVGDINNFQRIEPGGDINAAVAQIQSRQMAVSKALLADQLGPSEKANMSAEEIMTRNNQVRQTLGPIFFRFQSELVVPLTERAYSLRDDDDELPKKPDSLLNIDLEVEFKSPLSRSQKQLELEAQDQAITRLMNMMQVDPTLVDTFDGVTAIQKTAEYLGVNTGVIRDAVGIKKAKAAREKAQAAQQQALAQQEAAKNGQPPAEAQPPQG